MSAALEQRVATALGADTTSADLTALIAETEAAIAQADATANTERTRALDPVLSPDAKAAREAMAAAEFDRDRLHTLLPRMQQRLQQAQAAECAARWQLDFEQVAAKRDELAQEYAEFYPKLTGVLADLFGRAEAIDKEVSRINGSAPAGEHRRLADVELAARNLESFSTANPSIAKAVQLPDWAHSAKMAWPPPRPIDPAWFAPAVPVDRRYSADWWQVKEEEARALQERREREETEREAKALENYHGPRWWEQDRAAY